MWVAEKGLGEGVVDDAGRVEVRVVERDGELVDLDGCADRARVVARVDRNVGDDLPGDGTDTSIRRGQRDSGVSRRLVEFAPVRVGPGKQGVRSECRNQRVCGEQCTGPLLWLVPERRVGEEVERGVQLIGDDRVVGQRPTLRRTELVDDPLETATARVLVGGAAQE